MSMCGNHFWSTRSLARAHPNELAKEAMLLKMEKDQIAKHEAYVQLDLTRQLVTMRRELNNSLDTEAKQAQVIQEQDFENICLQNDIDDRDGQIDHWKEKTEAKEEGFKKQAEALKE
ncbi:hypothetical protein E8E11_008218 [Didymella keratinophila]|nr:hypothetical protein E8E11_008218 [Didymella keratinophila]